jgi:SAM-dependent methyltransferase
MVGRRAYDLMYRWWAPWDAVGVRPELRHLLADVTVSPDTHPRAIDLGCGTGANVVYLAEQGFRPTGVDFSPSPWPRPVSGRSRRGWRPGASSWKPT